MSGVKKNQNKLLVCLGIIIFSCAEQYSDDNSPDNNSPDDISDSILFNLLFILYVKIDLLNLNN